MLVMDASRKAQESSRRHSWLCVCASHEATYTQEHCEASWGNRKGTVKLVGDTQGHREASWGHTGAPCKLVGDTQEQREASWGNRKGTVKLVGEIGKGSVKLTQGAASGNVAVLHEVQGAICFNGKLRCRKRHVQRVLRVLVLQQDLTLHSKPHHRVSYVLQAASEYCYLISVMKIKRYKQAVCEY